MDKKIVYLMIEQDESGRDEIVGETSDIAVAKKWFDETKGTVSYCRYESVELVGIGEYDEPIYDNNDTIESYFEEDDQMKLNV